MQAISITIPDPLYAELRGFIESGWYPNEQELLAEALRRFLESHGPSLKERHIREDVEWGLHGAD
jgi:Arc/MetJ-type ribon-helix-helix transcriptional regulator